MISQFPLFKKLTIQDKNEIEEVTRKYPSYSNFNFGTLYSYNINDECEVSFLNNNLVVKFKDYVTGEIFLTFLGNTKVEQTIETLLDYAEKAKFASELRLIPEINIINDLDKLKQKYHVTIDLDSFDYIISSEELKALKEKSFAEQYPKHEVKELDTSNPELHKQLDDLILNWAKTKNKSDEDIKVERKAISRLLAASDSLNLVTLGIYHNGELIGFTINEVIHDEHYVGHFEKINEKYPGLSQYLEHMTAITLGKYGCRFMNYKQNIDLPGKPIQYLKKYTIKKKNLSALNSDGTIPLDITQAMYKRNMELLHERRHAEDLLYNVSEGVLAIDKAHNIILFNHTLEIMLDIPERDAIGKPVSEIVNIETQKGEPIDLKKYCFPADFKEESISEVVLKGKSKSYFVNVKFSIIESDGNEKDLECLITISDITKEILLDKAKDDFLSLASHELRTPMTVIKSYLSMLEDSQPEGLTEKQKKYLDRSISSTNDLIKLISDMLNISRMEQGRLTFDLKPVVINEILQEALAGLDLKAQEKNIYLKIEYLEIEPTTVINTDTTKFKEVIVNLVGNAIKFTKDGGVTVKIETNENNKFLKISVIDTGSGITKEESKKLFQKFGRTEGSYERAGENGGTGLGLYIVKLYAESMGGTADFFSEGENKGSAFWFTVPIEKYWH